MPFRASYSHLRRGTVNRRVVIALCIFSVAVLGWWIYRLALPYRSQLSRDKFFISDQQFFQVFSPYIDSKYPVFITSDACLAGFHTLLEASITRKETAQAVRLSKVLNQVARELSLDASIESDDDLARRAHGHATDVLAVALALLGTETESVADRPLVNRTVAMICGTPSDVEASGETSLWTRGIDLSRFKPRGFYTKSPLLERYFRAVNWLQSLPFSTDNEEQLLAFVLIADAMRATDLKADAGKSTPSSILQAYGAFLGQPDDWDLAFALNAIPAPKAVPRCKASLQTIRTALLKRVSATHETRGLINDRPDQAGVPAQRPIEWRILSAYQLPESVMFLRTTEPTQFQRKLPNGLEVCSALGSQIATITLQAYGGKKLVETVENARPLLAGSSLYHQYLDCLSELLNDADARAPRFVHQSAWQVKNCQTALAGWAQMRHTWILQSKPTIGVLSESEDDLPAGFVEPDPEFFASLADLVEATADLLDREGVFDLDEVLVSLRLRELAVLFDTEAQNDRDPLSGHDLGPAIEFLAQELNYRVENIYAEKDRPQIAVKLRELADRIDAGTASAISNTFNSAADRETVALSTWHHFERLCRDLSQIAELQLEDQALTKADENTIRYFGVALSRAMLYGGNSYYVPDDDAPRIADVFSSHEGTEILHVATGRPRAIYVLYPYQGREILCRGAVLPFFEVQLSQRFDDHEWFNLLTSPQCPDLPKWVEAIYSRGRPSAGNSTSIRADL